MNENSQVEPVAQVQPAVEDGTTFIEFINLTGDLSEALYRATHPEENVEVPRPIAIQ